MEIWNTANPAISQPTRSSPSAPKDDYGANGYGDFSQTLAKTSANDAPVQQRPAQTADDSQSAADDPSQTSDGQNSETSNQTPVVNVALKKTSDWQKKLTELDGHPAGASASAKTGATPDAKALRKALEKDRGINADDVEDAQNLKSGLTTGAAENPGDSAATDVQGLMSLLGGTNSQNAAQTVDDSAAASLLANAGLVKAGIKGQDRAVEAKGATNGMEAMPTDDTEVSASDTDRLFRFLKADGSGQPQEMLITGEKDPDKATERKAGLAGKAENILVMDSRRYLGFEQNENAGRVVAAIAGDKELSSALKTASTSDVTDSSKPTSTVVNTLKIQMHPLDLGVITATLRLKADELSVDIQVHSGEAYRQLTLDQDSITKSLQDQGFAVDSVNIQLIASDRTTSNMGDQQQDKGQQQAREGGAGSFGQQTREQSGNSRRDQTYGQAQTVEINTPVLSSDSTSAGLRPGQVYI
jgi:chemotaxis protein MotD